MSYLKVDQPNTPNDVDDSLKGEVLGRHWVMFVVLMIGGLYQILTHAMWRDELQTWSMIRESATLPELFHNLRFEGMPPLWYLSLWFVSFVSLSPLAMQLFHFVCAAVAAFLVMWRAPFKPVTRLLIVAGYYFSFEYLVISRCYVQEVLLAFIYCAFQKKLVARPMLRGTVLGLLANTTVYGTLLSFSLLSAELFDLISDYRHRVQLQPRLRCLARIAATYVPLLVVAVIVMIPAKGGNFAANWNSSPEFLYILYAFCKIALSLVPIPQPGLHFWNTVLPLDHGMLTAISITVCVLTSIWLVLRRSPRQLFIFSACFLFMLVFGVIKYLGSLRHSGTLMICFVVCIWLAGCDEAEGSTVSSSKPMTISANLALRVILLCNMLAWMLASYCHLRYDFSGSREMAEMIHRSGKDELPIVGYPDNAVSAVAGYLARPVYYAENSKAQTFIRWSTERNEQIGPLDVLNFTADLSGRAGCNVLLVTNYPFQHTQLNLLSRTSEAIVENEQFYLYEFAK